MRILHVTGSLDKKNGGTYSALTSIMMMENKLGYQNAVISTHSAGNQYDKEFFQDKYFVFEKSFPQKFRFSKKAIEWLKKNIMRYDLIVIHEVWGGIGLRSAITAKKLGIKYVIWPHGSLDPIDLRKKKTLKIIVGKLFLSSILKHAEAICCTSGMEKKLLETFDTKPKKVEVLSLPVDFDFAGNKMKFRQAYNIDNNDLVFIFLSRVTAGKGLDMLLIALKQFINSGFNFSAKAIIAGFGSQNKEHEEYIKSLIKTLGLEKNIILCGFLSGTDKADAFAAADCFILPSQKENFGISVVEALQSGLPVIISDNVYIWNEIIPEGGWLCKYDVSSLNASIKTSYDDIKGNVHSKTPKEVGNKFRSENLMKDYADFYKTFEIV